MRYVVKLNILAINTIYKEIPYILNGKKFIPMLGRQFPNILNKMLNHDCQQHPSDQNKSRSIALRIREPNTNFRCEVNNIFSVRGLV